MNRWTETKIAIRIIIMGVWIFAFGFPSAFAEENNQLPVRTNADRTVASIPIDASSVQAMNEMIDRLNRSDELRYVSIVVNTAGASPELLIAGDRRHEVDQVVSMFQQILANTNRQRNLVVISASLRELSQSDVKNIGINPMPMVGVTASRTFRQVQGDFDTTTTNYRLDKAAITATAADVVRLNEALAKSKILVSSEIFTPNGIKGQISNSQRIPIFTTDKNGNVNTDYQNLETSIDVTPTIVSYNSEKPEESKIRMDVTMRVSVVSGYRQLNSISAPEYTVKQLHTLQVLKADGAGTVVGSFVSDEILKGQSGIPGLSGIPILKYLFSQETNDKVRRYAVLTVGVRILPAGTK